MSNPNKRFPDKVPVDFLIFFAVKEEAACFDRASFGCQTLVTGMGRNNAARAIHEALEKFSPRKVITCGFCGGLNPDFALGTIVFEEDFDANIQEHMKRLGGVPARFHCSRRVAVTREEKAELFKSTQADVVEMESSVIRNICRSKGISSATIRVVLDTAHDSLPLDFNALMTSDDKISISRLVFSLLRAPGKVPELIRFQKQTVIAAQRLGTVLNELCLLERQAFEKE